MTQRIHADTGPCCRGAITAALAACTMLALLVCAACGIGGPPAAADTTLAAFTKNGDIEVSIDQAGHVTGTLAPWSTLLLELATSCPRLHANVNVNGVDVGLIEPGSGTQISGPDPVFRCALPTFVAKIDASAGASLDIRVWDETKEWVMHADFVSAAATLTESDGLRIGTWANVALVPAPAFARLEFVPADGGTELFSMSSTRGDAGCGSSAVVAVADGGASTTDAGVPCPLTFTDAGIALFVPDVPVGTGTLILEGWAQTEVTRCDGTGYCNLSTSGTRSGPVARIETSVTR